MGFSPQIIHLMFIGFSIIFTIQFLGGLLKGLTKFKSQAAAAVLGSSFTRSNFQSEGVSCHPGVLALWPKITLRMKEKGCRDISYDACVTSNPNTPPQLVAIHYQLTQKDLA